MGIFGDIVDGVGDFASGVSDGIADFSHGVVDGVTSATDGTVIDPLVDVVGGLAHQAIDAQNSARQRGIETITGIAGAAVAPVDGLCEAFDRGLEQLGKCAERLFERAKNWLSCLIEALVKKFLEALNWACEGVSDLLCTIQELLCKLREGMMAPKSLEEMAAMWKSGPATQLSGLADTISEQTLLADVGWNTPTGRAYAGGIPQQVAAVKAMESLANDTSTTLSDAASSLKTLYAEAGGTLGRICAALNGSPGSLFSIEGLLGLLGFEQTTIFDVIAAVKNFADEMTAQQEKLANMVTETGAFTGGKWPTMNLA